VCAWELVVTCNIKISEALPADTGFHDETPSSLENKIYVVPKRVCGARGLPWAAQHARLTKNPRLARHTVNIDIETHEGKRETLILDVDYLPT
jgi:hypothetical protein